MRREYRIDGSDQWRVGIGTHEQVAKDGALYHWTQTGQRSVLVWTRDIGMSKEFPIECEIEMVVRAKPLRGGQ